MNSPSKLANNLTMKKTLLYMVYCIDNNGDMHKDIEQKHTQNINSFMQIQFSIQIFSDFCYNANSIIKIHANDFPLSDSYIYDIFSYS